jgi:TonB family protein
MASVETSNETTVSHASPTSIATGTSEQEKKSNVMSASAMEIYKIETNQAAAMISQFIRKEVMYPALLKELGVESQMVVDFFIDRKGSIQKIKIIKGDSEIFNEKVLAVLSELKEIKIRYYLGASRIRIPINFTLQ